jgi:hypothetical protein
VFCLLIHAANALAFLQKPTAKIVALQQSIYSFAVTHLGSRPPQVYPAANLSQLLRKGFSTRKPKGRKRPFQATQMSTHSSRDGDSTAPLTTTVESSKSLATSSSSMLGVEHDHNMVYFGPPQHSDAIVGENDTNHTHADVGVQHLEPVEVVKSTIKRQKTRENDEEIIINNDSNLLSNNLGLVLPNVSVVLDSSDHMDVDSNPQLLPPESSGVTIVINEMPEDAVVDVPEPASTIAITDIKQLTIGLPTQDDERVNSKFISRVIRHVAHDQYQKKSMPAVIAKIHAQTPVINFCYLTRERNNVLSDLSDFEERHKRAKIFVVSCQIYLINAIRMVTWLCRVIVQYEDNAADSAKSVTENDVAGYCYRYLMSLCKRNKEQRSNIDRENEKMLTSWQIHPSRLADKHSINYIYQKDFYVWLKLLGRVDKSCKFGDGVVSSPLPPSRRSKSSSTTRKHHSNLVNAARLWIRGITMHSISDFCVEWSKIEQFFYNFVFELVWPDQPPECLESGRIRSGEYEPLRLETVSVALGATNVINAPLDATQIITDKEMARRARIEMERATVNLIWNYYRIYSHQYSGNVAPVNLYIPNLQNGERKITEDRIRREEIRAEIQHDESYASSSYEKCQNNLTNIADSMFEELNLLLQQSKLQHALEQQMVDFPLINCVNGDNDICDIVEDVCGVSFRDTK